MSLADLQRAAARHADDKRMQRLRAELRITLVRAAAAGLTPQEWLDITMGYALGVMIADHGVQRTAEQVLPATFQEMQRLLALLASPEAKGTA